MSHDFSSWDEAESPTSKEANFRWKIMRANHLKPIKFAVASVHHYGCYTHYWHKRTGPHLKHGCQACIDGIELRWYGFLLAKLFPEGTDVIFQYPPKCAPIIEEAEKDHGSLRGLIFVASRPGGKNNSPVHLAKHNGVSKLSDLPVDEPVRPLLAHIWGFKESVADAIQKQVLSEASEAEAVAAGFKRQKVSAAEFAAATQNDIVLLPGQDRLFQRSFTEPNGHALPIVQ